MDFAVLRWSTHFVFLVQASNHSPNDIRCFLFFVFLVSMQTHVANTYIHIISMFCFEACPNRACFYKLRACLTNVCLTNVCLFLMLSESQNGKVWLTIILETQLSLEKLLELLLENVLEYSRSLFKKNKIYWRRHSV